MFLLSADSSPLVVDQSIWLSIRVEVILDDLDERRLSAMPFSYDDHDVVSVVIGLTLTFVLDLTACVLPQGRLLDLLDVSNHF